MRSYLLFAIALATSTAAAAQTTFTPSEVRITRTDEFEAQLLAALERRQGTLIEVMLDPEVISTRGTLSGIRNAALKK